jgi:hypothetical protein
MALAAQGSAKGTNQTGTSITSLASSAVSVTAGWLAVVVCRTGGNVTHSAPTDTAGNTYVQIGTTIGVASNDYLSLWYCASCAAQVNNVVTGHWGSSAYCSILVGYISGAAAAPLDKNASNTGSGTSIASGQMTTTQADEILVAGFSYGNNNATISAGAFAGTTGTLWTTSGSSNSGDTGLGYRIVSGIVTNATLAMGVSPTQNGLCILAATFKMASGPVTGPVPMFRPDLPNG